MRGYICTTARAFGHAVSSSWQHRHWKRQHPGGIVHQMENCGNAEDFVARFAEFWLRPSPQRLPALLHPDVVLVQPLAAPMIGIAAAQADFRRIWSCLPDLRAHVDRWAGDSAALFIEFRLRAHVGADAIEWPVVNRLVLDDGLAIERVTYFDPLVVLPKLLRHPPVWWRWLRSQTIRA
jgi:hypothetical protein